MFLNTFWTHLSCFTLISSVGFIFFNTVGLAAPVDDRLVISQIPGVQLSQVYDVPQRLSNSEIQAKMRDIPDWELEGNTIQAQRQFRDFVEAIAFVNRLVEPAEAMGHHPDISISYNTVTITLTTHDAGGLTEQDFALAAIISEINE